MKRPTAQRSTWQRVAGAAIGLAGVVAAILYAEVPIEAVLGFPLDPSRSLLSDLDATGQPTQALFAWAEIVSGALIVLLAALAWRRTHGWLERVTAGILAALGAISIADALVPLPCSHTGGRCAPGGYEASATSGGIDIPHSITSVGASVLGFALALALALIAAGAWGAARRSRALIWWTWGTGLVLIAATLVLSYFLSLPATPAGYAAGTGWWQRLQELASGLDIALVVPLWRLTRWPTPAPGPDPDPARAAAA